VIYKGILGKNSEFLWQSVVGRPHFLASRSAPEPNSTQSFPVAFYPLRTQRSYAWNRKILRRTGSLPLKSLNSSPSPSLLFHSLLHLLSCHGYLQCPVHCCCHEDDPSVERGTSHQGRIIYTSRINRLGEGLRRCKGGHQRSRRAIGNDGQTASQVPWPVGHYWWPIDPLEVGQPSPARQSSPAAQGRGSCLVCALSPHLMIGKKHHRSHPHVLLRVSSP
jgi:hypothetical protein